MSTLKTGSTLQGGKYSIVKVLGQGGFGITYLARQGMLKKNFAIKEFFIKNLCERDENSKVYTSSESEMVARYRNKFFREAQMMAKLNHPGIVRVSDVFEENNTVYYVMEHIEGESLADIIHREGCLSEKRALHYVLEVAKALGYIHKLNINHLDIKPSNIMVRREDNMPILIDFGISKQYDEQKDQVTSTPPGVSDGFSPIEQYSPGGVSTFSPQSDIYALGATLYKMLTGKTPPDASTVLNDGLPNLPKSISYKTRNAIKMAMQPKIGNRLATVKEFIDLLSEKEDTTPPRPEPHHHANATSGSAWKWSVGGGLVGLCVLLLLVQIYKHFFNQDLLKPKYGAEVSLKQKTIIDNLVANMVSVEGGTFDMGATIQQSKEANEDESPVHEVTLSSFYIGRYEVTQEEWEAVMGNNPSGKIRHKHPVDCVSWYDCQNFISKLNAMTHLNFRLPTEGEWEFAARGRSRHFGYEFAGSNNIDNVAWYFENSQKAGLENPSQVGLKKPNELGLYDMTGNVLEWCSDWYGKYSSSPQTNPQGPTSGTRHVDRGGSWIGGAKRCRVTRRDSTKSNGRYNFLGLRLAHPGE